MSFVWTTFGWNINIRRCVISIRRGFGEQISVTPLVAADISSTGVSTASVTSTEVTT